MSNKNPIEWHERCLENMKRTLERDEQSLSDLQSRVDDLNNKISFYASQICRAKLMGKDGFDSDRFLVAKKRANKSLEQKFFDERFPVHLIKDSHLALCGSGWIQGTNMLENVTCVACLHSSPVEISGESQYLECTRCEMVTKLPAAKCRRCGRSLNTE